MSEREDAILERLIQRLENPDIEDPGLDLSDEERRVWREYAELVGLLPQALDPVAPRPETRARLMAAVRAEASTASRYGGERHDPVPSVYSSRSLQLVAAVLGALAVAMALMSVWMFRTTRIQGARIAEVRAALEASLDREAQLAQIAADMSGLRRVVTAAGMRVCPLKPGKGAPQPVARGAVYFETEKATWFLAA
ncbi:MAG: hypothetical protein R3190_12665, partial [Thermoanaerobaculia bacterium]|nr:hypothetical protein [Thermoanaerobaculia bacterium]